MFYPNYTITQLNHNISHEELLFRFLNELQNKLSFDFTEEISK